MRMTAVSVVALMLLITGCSRVPKSSSYEYSYQSHMQAVHHWNVLAQDVANQIASKVVDSTPPQSASAALQASADFGAKAAAPVAYNRVSVPSTAQSPFDVAFRTLLVSALNQRGVPVGDNGRFRVDWDVMPVAHAAERSTSYPGGWISRAFMYTVVGAVVNVDPVFENGVPHSEVIITTRLNDSNNLVMQRSDIFYVNDGDGQHYSVQRPTAQKTFRVVDK